MPPSHRAHLHGEGLGLRPALVADLLRSPDTVDFVELTYEAHRAGDARRQAIALADVWPVAVHGIGLSLGAADGIDPARARALGDFARDTRASLLTEHAAFVRSGDRSLAHLTALPFNDAAIRAIARNLARARRHFPDVPFAIENVAFTVRYPDDTLPEGAFYEALVERTGVPLLLDVGNVFANATNAGVDPATYVASFPLERVAMIHVAGGIARGGFYYDTHGHDTPGAVLELLALVLARTGPVPITLERDEHVPTLATLRGELDHARLARSASAARRASPTTIIPERDDVDDDVFASQQRAVAAWLQSGATPPGFAPRWGDISRAILLEKRVGDAAAHLPRLGRVPGFDEALARALADRPRGAGEEGVDEAARVAEELSVDPRFEDAASRDGAAIRARFVRSASGRSLRVGPFVERVARPDGKSFWVFKAPGREARLRIVSARQREAASSPATEVR